MDGFRTAIRAYATNLRNALKGEIGVINSIGGKLPRSVYQDATVQKHVSLRSDEWAGRHEQTPVLGGFDAHDHRGRDMPPPLSEVRALDEWIEQGFTKNLLIIAPVGAGKSCLLESLALRLVEDLLDDEKWQESQPLPPAVPLLVSLARWERWMQQHGRTEWSLNEYLRHAENEITEQPAALDVSTMQRLTVEKRLILLIDGFDELPHRRDLLVRLLNDLHVCFVLTSRPGHGEHLAVPDESGHHTLAEMTSTSALRFVQSYFIWIAMPSFDSEAALKLFRDAQSGPAGTILNRPLYVKAWCEYVHGLVYGGRLPVKAPASLGELAEQLVRDFIRRRRILEPLRIADPFDHGASRQVRDNFAAWLGRLGAYFAERNFAPSKLTNAGVDEELEAINHNASCLIAVDGKNYSFDFKDIAINAGMLIKSEFDEYFLLKLPVVEYLVGRWVADESREHPDTPKRLIRTFRSWIWRPQLHGILDYVFDALWHGTAKQRQWATDLLRWAVETGKHDATRDLNFKYPAQDDLVHPFALTVLRWHALNPDANGSHEAREAATESGPAIIWSLRMEFGLPESLSGSALPQDLVNLLVEGLAHCSPASHNARSHTPDDLAILRLIHKQGAVTGYKVQNTWQLAAGYAAERVIEQQAAEFVERLIQQHNTADCPAMGTWLEAIEAAAGRVAEDKAPEVIERWIQQYDSANDEAGQAWLRAIGGAARRVAADKAAGVIERWIQQYDSANDTAMQAWLWAIGGAARRVAKEKAAQVIEQLIHHYKAARDDLKKPWLRTIEMAARCVPGEQAAEVVERLIQQSNLVDDATKEVWEWAVENAAMRVTEVQAPQFVQFAIQRFVTTEGNAKEAWLWTIETAARRVAEDQAAQFVGFLIQHLGAAEAEVPEAWLCAIKGVASCVSNGQAAQVVEQLIHEAEDNWPTDLWVKAIQEAAVRVSKDEAAGVIERWIQQYNATDDAVNGVWLIAIHASAGCVLEGHAARIIEQLSQQFATEAGDAMEAWLWVIKRAASCISGEQAAQVIEWMIRQHDSGQAAAKGLWVEGIQAAAGRVAEDRATQVVERLLQQYNAADEAAKLAWLLAIEAAAGCVAEEQAVDVVERFIQLYEGAKDGAKDVWLQAIDNVAGRARGEFRVTIAQRLLVAGLFDRLVLAGDAIAILSNRSTDAQTVTHSYVLRSDPTLVLDRNAVAAPESIRRVIGPWVTAEELYERLRNLISDDIRKNQLKGRAGSRHGHLPPWAEAPQQIRRAALAIGAEAARQACAPWDFDENAGPLSIDVEAICKNASRLLQIAQNRIPNAAEELAHYLYYRFVGTGEKLNQAEIAKAFKCRGPGAFCAALGLDLRDGDHEGFLHINSQRDVSIAIGKVNAWAHAGCIDQRPGRLEKCRTPEEWLAAGGVYIHPKPQSLNAIATTKRLAFSDPAFVAEADAEDRRVRRRGRGKLRE